MHPAKPTAFASGLVLDFFSEPCRPGKNCVNLWRCVLDKRWRRDVVGQVTGEDTSYRTRWREASTNDFSSKHFYFWARQAREQIMKQPSTADIRLEPAVRLIQSCTHRHSSLAASHCKVVSTEEFLFGRLKLLSTFSPVSLMMWEHAADEIDISIACEPQQDQASVPGSDRAILRIIRRGKCQH